MQREFTTIEISKYTEIPRRTLYRWKADGLLPNYKSGTSQGPGQGDVHDKAIGVYAMFLDEYGKRGGAFSGQGAGEVWLFREDRELDKTDSRNNYDGPHLLGDSAHIVDYLRRNDYALAAMILSGKLGFSDTPSRDRFCDIQIVPLEIAYASVPQFVTTRVGYFRIGLEGTHIVKSMLLISIDLLHRAFDYAVNLKR